MTMCAFVHALVFSYCMAVHDCSAPGLLHPSKRECVGVCDKTCV